MRKEGWIEQGKMGEMMHQGRNGKKKEERNAIRVHENDREEERQNKTSEDGALKWRFKVVLKVQLRVRETWRKLLSAPVYLFVCMSGRCRERERKRADACAYRSRAGRMSLYDSAAPVITD